MKKRNDITVREWVKSWQMKKKTYIKESTYATYTNIITNHILPYFDNMLLGDIDSKINQDFILYLSQCGRTDNAGGLADKTVKDIFNLWLSIIKGAEKENYMQSIENQYQYPICYHIERNKCLSREQEHKIIAILEKNLIPRNIGILLALTTGMRIGEICALQWNEIDLNAKTIKVVQTLQRIYTKTDSHGFSQVIITTPKSRNSIRVIPLSTKMTQILKKIKKSKECYFLTGEKNKWIEPRVYREYYNRLMKRNETLYVSFHGLRHTFATRCVEIGCDYKTLSEILGHASINTTMSLYVHSDLKKKRECIEKTQALFKVNEK